MLFGPDPLTERLTLLWHDHFATSNLKVDDLALMRRQNETLRSLSRAPFGRLLHAMLRDPALLDLARRTGEHQRAPQRKPGPRADGAVHPRDRPLFRGRRQAGRPRLTGWKLVDDEARLVPVRHDAATKTILGRKGAFDADGLAALLLDHSATSRRLAWRLCHEFFGEGAIDDRAIGRARRGTAGPRSGHRLGRRDGAPLAPLL